MTAQEFCETYKLTLLSRHRQPGRLPISRCVLQSREGFGPVFLFADYAEEDWTVENITSDLAVECWSLAWKPTFQEWHAAFDPGRNRVDAESRKFSLTDFERCQRNLIVMRRLLPPEGFAQLCGGEIEPPAPTDLPPLKPGTLEKFQERLQEKRAQNEIARRLVEGA